MNTLHMEHLVDEQPQIIWSLLAFQWKETTADFIQDLFKVTFSPSGSNALRKEQAVIMKWYTSLQECEGESLYRTYVIILNIINFLIYMQRHLM